MATTTHVCLLCNLIENSLQTNFLDLIYLGLNLLISCKVNNSGVSCFILGLIYVMEGLKYIQNYWTLSHGLFWFVLHGIVLL